MTTPRYLTPRTSRYTHGPKIAQLSKLLGRPLMPWQQLAADLIGEHDGTGRLLHPLVVVTVPRQSGKTALMGAVMLHRMMMRTQARVWYTAQTGLKARDQLKELMELVELSAMSRGFACRRGNDNTSIELPALKSRIVAHPPTADSLHSNQSDLNLIDEGWFFDEEQGTGLMGAIVPTQATRPNAQTIIVSTSGTARSTWFHGYVNRGRAGELPLIDYGVALAVTDPLDFNAIADAHPAIGLTQEFDILPAAYKAINNPGEFMRAYGNRQTVTSEPLIPLELIEKAITTDDLPGSKVTFAAATAFDRTDSVIVACALDAAGIPWVEVTDVFDGTTAAGPRCADLTARHGGSVTIDGTGPGVTIADDAERGGGRVERVNAADLSAAVTDLLDRLKRPLLDPDGKPAIRMRAHAAFTAALDAAVVRNSGDRLTLARRGSAGSVAALEAAALAVRAALGSKPPVPPMIWS